MSRCKSCNLRLESFDDLLYCKRCIKASEDTTTDWKDPQLKLLTDTKQVVLSLLLELVETRT